MSAQDAGLPAEQARLPEVPPELAKRRLSLGTIVKFFGPGAIIASLTVLSVISISGFLPPLRAVANYLRALRLNA